MPHDACVTSGRPRAATAAATVICRAAAVTLRDEVQSRGAGFNFPGRVPITVGEVEQQAIHDVWLFVV